MDILYTLIPLSVVLIFLVIAVLAWAVFNGQFEDLATEASRILSDDDAVVDKPLDLDQAGAAAQEPTLRLSSRRP